MPRCSRRGRRNYPVSNATDSLEAGTITITGQGGDEIEAYLARPTGGALYGGMVVIHHLPGYDAGNKEIVRRFAANGYAALCPNPSLGRSTTWP